MSNTTIRKIESYLNEYILEDIQLMEAGDSCTKLAFFLPDKQYIETPPFNDQELEQVIDMILASKSKLSLGC